jgi:two-component system, cell cycle response regulator
MGKKVVMIVDDERTIVDLIKLTLGDDYTYLEAYDGPEALEKARTLKPDLILLDIMMPKMDGFEVAKRLKSDPATKDIVIAMVSAKKEDHDILTGIDMGAISFITKPFNPFELQEKVAELMQLACSE